MEVQVIEKIQGRIDRTTGLKINERLKVAAYARVSTDSEDQLNSFESQVKYYNEKISHKLEWSLVEVYADESISGTQDYKRSNFMRMIADAMSGKIDLILTKSISRFARNTLDTLKYVRMLKEKNVAILFEEENINTLEMAGELLLTILSSVAQQESETISAHVKLGLKMKQQRGEPYEGQVAVGAVILNRVKHSSFPNTIAGVIYEKGAFTAVDDGQINEPISENSTVYKAAQDALNGWDPTNGCIYYFNPDTATSKWIWSRTIVKTIGKHHFCK